MNQPEKKCDGCGEPIKGKAFQMVDENYNKQHGLFECAGCHFGEEVKQPAKKIKITTKQNQSCKLKQNQHPKT